MDEGITKGNNEWVFCWNWLYFNKR